MSFDYLQVAFVP